MSPPLSFTVISGLWKVEPQATAVSRAMPHTLRQSGRLASTSKSITVSSMPRMGRTSAPRG